MTARSTSLSFVVQAPDNVGADRTLVAPWIADIAWREGRSPDEVMRELINRVTRDGTAVALGSPRARLRRRRDEFALEIDLDAHDNAGRIVPVLCYGRVSDAPTDALPSWLSDQLLDFLDANGLRGDADLAVLAMAAGTQLSESPRSLLGGIANFWRGQPEPDYGARAYPARPPASRTEEVDRASPLGSETQAATPGPRGSRSIALTLSSGELDTLIDAIDGHPRAETERLRDRLSRARAQCVPTATDALKEG